MWSSDDGKDTTVLITTTTTSSLVDFFLWSLKSAIADRFTLRDHTPIIDDNHTGNMSANMSDNTFGIITKLLKGKIPIINRF